MEIFKLLDNMTPFVLKRHWDELEIEFRKIGEQLASPEMIDRIARVDASVYQQQLCAGLSAMMVKARKSPAKAIYFEYDLDDDWDGHFFLCQDYARRSDYKGPGNDDWACDWIDDIDAGNFMPFGELYVPGFDKPTFAMGVNIFLIARTVATFGRCCENYVTENVAICMAFHDQDPVVRIHEPF